MTTGLVRFRSPLLTESRLMSFPPATEMFQFAGFASLAYGFSQGYPFGWVAPFGDPGINDRSHLPRAFRSVPRPSSPLSAKASTRCPSFALETAPNGKHHEARHCKSNGVGRVSAPAPDQVRDKLQPGSMAPQQSAAAHAPSVTALSQRRHLGRTLASGIAPRA